MSSLPNRTRQVAAIVSLLCVAALVVVLAVFLWNNAWDLVIAIVGLAITACGGWWVVTRPMPRRAVGGGVALLGLVVILGALINAFSDADRVIVRLSSWSSPSRRSPSRWPCSRLRGRTHGRSSAGRSAPSHPVLICNPWSGGGKVEKFGLVELAEELGVEVVMLDHGLDLEQLARDAIARGADCLGMAGGDGSQALVASIADRARPAVRVRLGRHPQPLRPRPRLDRDDPRDSHVTPSATRSSAASTTPRSTAGSSSTTCRSASTPRSSSRTSTATPRRRRPRRSLPELLGRRHRAVRPPVHRAATAPRSTAPSSSRCRTTRTCSATSLDDFQRRRLDTGQLGVIAVTRREPPRPPRLVAARAVGLRQRSRNWHEFTTDTFEVRSRSGKAFVGVDGEALEMDTPLRFEMHPGGSASSCPRATARGRAPPGPGCPGADLADVALGRA